MSETPEAVHDPRVIAAYRVLKDGGVIAPCVPFTWVMIKIAAALEAAEKRRVK